MLRVRYHPAARAELRAAVTRSEDERRGRGFALDAAVERVEHRIRQLPHSAPTWPTVDAPFEIRRARVQKFPYLLVYGIRPDELVILAVAHKSRQPGYWQERIDEPQP